MNTTDTTDKIVNIKKSIKIAEQLKNQGKSIVLVGGCFDILHVGHIEFFQKAKKHGDFLFVILESDQAIKSLKGNNRPINLQEDRARVLDALKTVDFVIPLPRPYNDNDYDDLVKLIKPDIIATTKGDPFRKHKERQARLTGAHVIDVIRRISDKSTTNISRVLSKNKYL